MTGLVLGREGSMRHGMKQVIDGKRRLKPVGMDQTSEGKVCPPGRILRIAVDR